jgi:hypothetical protein
MFEFTQIGWFDPGSKRFCYTDEKEYDRSLDKNRFSGYTHPVFSIDPNTASRLSVQLMPQANKPEDPTGVKEYKYCPAGRVYCMHSYVNDSGDMCCNPNHIDLPVGIGVVVGASGNFPGDEVCRWPSKMKIPKFFS